MDVATRLSRLVFFPVAANYASLGEAERTALAHCVAAADAMTQIYLRQVSAQNPAWIEALQRKSDAEGRDLLRYVLINAGPWDQFNEDEPFLPLVGPRPPGAAFYPLDLTEQEWHRWLEGHPQDRESFLSSHTVIERRQQALLSRPYSEVYRPFLIEAAEHLRLASRSLDAGTLKHFLELRADAFLSNRYYDSDLAWVDTDGSPFEVTIGPYETYLDRFLGLKASFEAFIGLPDKESTAALELFSGVLPSFDAILAERFGYIPKGSAIPLEVVIDVYRGGEAAFGRQFVAYNLPNDRAIHEVKGSKKVFSRTMMQAKFTHVTSPIAARLLPPEHLAQLTFANRLLFVLGHELAHGLGCGLLERGAERVRTETLLRDTHSLIEEAKANTLGVALLKYFFDMGLLTSNQLAGAITTELVQYAQEWRTGYHEAHSAGSLVEYNWLKAHDAVRYDTVARNLDLDIDRTIAAMQGLSDQLLQLQSEGDYDRAKAFIRRWSGITPEIRSVVEHLKDLPSEVVPLYQPPVVDEPASR